MNRGGTDEDDVRYAHLILRCPGRPYVSSSTAAGRKRTRGAFDAQLEYHRYFSGPTTLPAMFTDYHMKLNVTTTPTFWSLEWMKAAKVEAIVDTESMENIGAKIFMEFNGSNGTVIGAVKDPATSTKWPFS